MFASTWQLLTAIFFLSALTKLIYKLIKEVDRRPSSSQPAAGTFAQVASVEPEVAAQGHLDFGEVEQQQQQQQQQLRQRRSSLGQIGWSSPASPSSLSVSSSSSWSSPNSWASGRSQQQWQRLQQPSQQESQDSDEEELVFEEALGFVLSQATGGPTRNQLDEERRLQEARWLTRQLFRRQLNRLSAADQSSASEPLEELGEEEPEVEEEARELGVQAERTLEQDGDHERATAEGADGLDSGSTNFGHVGSLSGSSSSSSSTTRAASNSPQATRSGSASNRKWSTFNLSCLVAEVFLLEPVKLTLSILSGTFAIFCGFLDFIEGIEHSPADESEQGRARGPAGARQATSLPAGAGSNRGQSYRKRAATAAQQVRRPAVEARSELGSQQQQRPQPQRQEAADFRRRSNYFHRRYFSRRSLSAALLSDDQDQVAS